MSILSRLIPALLPAIVLVPCRVMAQGDTAAVIRLADDVRFTPRDSRTADGRWCLGRVSSIDQDSLILARAPGCAAGVVTGLVWPSGPIWLPVSEARAVRLGGLSLRPALGIAFAPHR